MQLDNALKIVIIIVTYNAMKWIDRCLNSIDKSTIPCDVFIVDNGSKDGTQDYIRKNYSSYIFKKNEQNLGFGKANNVGMQYALDNGYSYVYLLNQDAWLMPDTLEVLINTQKEHQEFGIISPIQIQANGKHIDTSFLNATLKTPKYVEDLYREERGKLYEQNLIMAAHWLISRECLQKVGGFSPTFPHYGEDNNYASRALYHGFKVGFADSAKAVHDRENRVDSIEKKMYFYYIGLLVNFSDMNIAKYKLVLPNIWVMFTLMVKYSSFKPIGYFLKFLSEISLIRRNYKVSMYTDCAFLNK